MVVMLQSLFIDNDVFFLEGICNGCGKTTLLFRNFQSFIQQGSKLATNWSHMRLDVWLCA